MVDKVMDKADLVQEAAAYNADIENVYRDKLPVNASPRVNNRTPR